MNLNNTPSGERIHIGIFGNRNVGKSSIINAITGQDLAIVSDTKGTTTDPVLKAMELPPLGPVVMIDTPGLDDVGELGKMRIEKAYQILNKTDIAVLVVDCTIGMTEADQAIVSFIEKKNVPYIIVMNKSDLLPKESIDQSTKTPNTIYVSAIADKNILALKEMIGSQTPSTQQSKRIVGDLLDPDDFVILVVPIDSAAPKGRLILPQQQTIRDILETDASAIVVKENQFKATLSQLGKPPKLVITDSQVFEKVAAETPSHIALTSFSILFARYKGNLKEAVKGAYVLDTVQDGDAILISEGCTHHRQCEDIGTVKLPRWISEHTGKKLQFSFTSGVAFPNDLSHYKLIIHCGGCMLNDREMKYRIACAQEKNVPISNYGIVIAHTKGILSRCADFLI